MYPADDRLTLDALLSDPLTQLVMRSDNLTPADVARAFHEARTGLSTQRRVPYGTCPTRCVSMEHDIRWSRY